MPGPKMGSRPPDFDEELIRKAPTFQKWLTLKLGQKLRYACREFVKGEGDDEERLMRRIMIARRNNLRDHEMLKRARELDPERAKSIAKGVLASTRVDDAPAHQTQSPSKRRGLKRRKESVDGDQLGEVEEEDKSLDQSLNSPDTTRRKMSDESAGDEIDMDEAAVMSTRSYRTWSALEDGKEFSYNQKYIKGKDGHDFLLKKNIWRRMRYRRENKKMVEKLKVETGLTPKQIPLKKPTSRHPRSAKLESDLPQDIQISTSNAEPTRDSHENTSQVLPLLEGATLSFVGYDSTSLQNFDAQESDEMTAAAAVAAAAAAAAASLDNLDPTMQSMTNAAVELHPSQSHSASYHQAYDAVDEDLEDDNIEAPTWHFDGSALDAAYKLAAATANVEEVAAAVAAAAAAQTPNYEDQQNLDEVTSAALDFQHQSEYV